MFFAFNVASNTRVISVSPASSATLLLISVYEFNNIDTAQTAADGSSGNNGTSASITGGSFTPGNANDFLFQWAYSDGALTASGPTSYTVGSAQGTVTWTLCTADIAGSVVAQYGQQGTAAAINPTVTQSGSIDFVCVAAALKTASAGSAPSGLRIVGVQHLDTGDYGNPTSFTQQFPCAGCNLVVAVWQGPVDLSSVSSTPSNSWSDGGGAASNSRIRYAANASTSNALSVTCTLSSSTAVGTLLLYGVAGANTSPFDLSATNSGTQSSNSTPQTLTSISITPTTSNGIVFACVSIALNTVGSVNLGLFDSITYDGEVGNNVSTDRNNGWVHYYNPNTSAESYTWTMLTNAQAVSGWSSVAAAFIAAPTAVPVEAGDYLPPVGGGFYQIIIVW